MTTTFKHMKKTLLTSSFCLILAGAAFAQDGGLSMKSLTINALMQYGQKLYDRGDLNGARDVFNHVLVYDHYQPQALKYIKEIDQPAQNNVTVKESDYKSRKMLDLNDAESLKEAIAAKKQAIENLHAQIMQMRANIAALSKT